MTIKQLWLWAMRTGRENYEIHTLQGPDEDDFLIRASVDINDIEVNDTKKRVEL